MNATAAPDRASAAGAGRRIDLRSDTVTQPTEAMREAMRTALVGDDGLDGDPTVRELEIMGAKAMGKEDALFVASGTMGNLIAALVHASRGGEALVDEHAHVARSEGGGISRLAGLMCTPVRSCDGMMDLDALAASMRDGYSRHGAPTAMVVVETSHNHAGGRALPLSYLEAVGQCARAAGAAVHLDGARIFNAAVAQGVPPAALAAFSDTVTFCLSKGLSAPMGSILAGSRDFVVRARSYRRMVGGGLRQAGCVAAAGVVALRDMVDRLAEDHRRAHALWASLRGQAPALVGDAPDTNIVMVRAPSDAVACAARLASRGILVRPRDADTLRIVTHRHIDDAAIRTAAAGIAHAVETGR
ncbi:MAG: GntG family PLP-dependent aldolase [Pigmentiphaga sp.]|uniref:GntG family PLP-dependent aldolase n=1 Tax=Pigmentiphaga sp. TaxID=1977564 RepID=UPI0029A18717|nr:GntG family PLP-dependent aldolase [Pigmentiphaga sp.]MDX3906958.1 GntG family PLP-dependent aldolase [Pigmentiphaga sp.]